MKQPLPRRRAAGWIRNFAILAVCAGIALLLRMPPVPAAAALDLKAPPLSPLAEDGIHDPTGEAINILQDPAESMKAFPKDKRGEVDWVRALDQGVIKPRKSRTDDPWENALMQPMDMNILMTSTADMPYVLFPHRQ
ncbi:MAG: hypothetical protein AB7K73_06365, partial [Gammaproteobacteria bacterium]